MFILRTGRPQHFLLPALLSRNMRVFKVYL